MNFSNYKCFFQNKELGNCNDFVDSDFTSNEGIVLSLEEAVKFQKKNENRPILIYENTDKNLVEYFKSIGGAVI